MITIHEAGHYTAGKILKFKINEFAIGFGKPFYKKTKKNGEVFSIRFLPLGGFCAFEGEDEDKPASKGAFNNQPVWKRLIVLFMGPFFNFLSAILFAIILLLNFGYADKVVLTKVEVPNSMTGQEQNWLMEGDLILKVNGVDCDFVTDNYFVNMIKVYDFGEEFSVTVRRNGQEITLQNIKKTAWQEFSSKGDATYGKLFTLDGTNYNYTIVYNAETAKYQIVKIANGSITDRYDIEDGLAKIDKQTIRADYTVTGADPAVITDLNMSYSVIGVTTKNYTYSFFEALGYSFLFCIKWAWKILMILWLLITFQLPITQLGGTITTIAFLAESTHASFANLLLLFPLISINLAVFNLLPFPALDGARMVFVGIEGIRGKPISRKVESMIHFVGLIILFSFVLIVDILHFVL